MDYPFYTLVDSDRMQALLVCFSNLCEVAVSVLDLDNKVLAHVGGKRLCEDFHSRHSVCGKNCRHDVRALIAQSKSSDGLCLNKCSNGLSHVAIPVIILGKHVANILVGQFFNHPPDQETYRQKALEYGFDQSDYIQAVYQIPVINQEKMAKITNFISFITTQLAEIGSEKLIQLQSFRAQLSDTEKHLRFIGQQLPGVVWSTDTNLCYTFYSDRSTSRYATAKNVIGMSISQRMNINDPDDLMISMHQKALTGKSVNYEYDYRHRIWEIHLEPFRNAGGEIIGTLGMGLDISKRRRAEQALVESEKTYRDLFDNSAILLFTLNLEGHLTSLNKYASSHLGYQPEELIGMPVFDIILPHYHDLVNSQINNKLKGADITTYDIEVFDHKGNIRSIELNTRLIHTNGTPIGIQGAGRDITEQKRVQEALEASEQKFRTLAEKSTAIVYIIKENLFVYVNPALMKLTGYNEKELLNMNFWDVVHPDHREMALIRGLGRQKGIDVPASYELKLLNKNGNTIWIYLSSSRIVYDGEAAIMGSAIDFTELKRGEAALHESKMLLNHIIDFLPDATLVIDSYGQVLAWNKAMEKMTGLAASDVLGKGNYEYSLPFYGERQPILIDLVLRNNELFQQRYYEINRSDNNLTGEVFVPNFGSGGSYLWGVATPLYNADGEVTGAIESIRDVTYRKQMEIELANQAESLKLILENSPAGTAIVDNEDRLLFLNSRVTEIIGYTLDDIPNVEIWSQKAYPDKFNRRVVMGNWNLQLKIKQRARTTTRVHCKDGQVRDIEFQGVMLPDQRIIVSLWDMTWQKQVEESLRIGEARFKALSDASFEGIILTENSICIEVNQQAATMFGYSIQEMIGMNAVDLATPESKAMVQSYIINDYELPYEGSALRKDGSSLPVAIQGRMFEYQGRRIRAAAIRDLSERQQAQAELSRQTQNLQALFFNSPDALALCNNDKKIIDINPQFVQLFGYTLEECRYKEVNQIIVPPDRMNEYEEHRDQLFTGLVEKETVRKHKNGQTFDVMLKTVPIANCGFYIMYSDISTRKQTEQIISEQLRELEAKNAEMERFTYTVSHDLRSPIITIKGFAGLLLDDLKGGNYNRMDNDLQRIINAAGKMDDLLRDLLELSRIGRMLNTFSEFPMSRLAHEVDELLTGSLQDRGVELLIDPDMPIIKADQARIREVLQNLVENAIKFMGDISQPQIHIGYLENYGEWTFFVRDNGIGVDPRYQHSIFGLFNKLDPNCEGTGIGLSLVKRIIEFHHGRIWVESPGLNQGSTFYFTLPQTPVSKHQ